MFVVLAAPHYPPRNIGGVEIFVQSLARWLHQQGHRVEVVCVERIEYGPFPRVAVAALDRSEGFPVYRLAVRWRKGPQGLRDRFDNPAMELWFKAYLHSRKPDLIHFHSGYLLTVSPLRAAMKAGIPTIVSLHDFWFLCAHHTLLRPSGQVCPGPEDPAGCAYCWLSQSRRYRWMEHGLIRLGASRPHLQAGRLLRPLLRPWVQAMERRRGVAMEVLNQASAIHVPSTFIQARHQAFGLRSQGVHRIPLFISSEFSKRPSDRRDPSGLHGVYIGQIAPHKGIHVLIEGIQRAKAVVGAEGRFKLRFTIYGNVEAFPRYRIRLERLIAQDPSIRLAGPLPRERLSEALAEADVLALPSIWPENSPLIVLEALAAGVPVLASAVGGVPELVRHGENGWLVPPGDARAIAEALAGWIRQPEALERLRAQAQPPFSFEQAMEAMIRLYEATIREPAAGPSQPTGVRVEESIREERG